MRQKLIIFISSVFTFLIGGLLIVEFINAQESTTGIIASPPYIVETLSGSSNITEEIRITNSRETTETIYVSSREVAFDDEGNSYMPEGYNFNSGSYFEQQGWITFSPKTFDLNTGESAIVSVEINIPQDLITKAYYLELAFSTLPPDEPAGGVGTAPEIVFPIVINYIGQGKPLYDLGILEFKTDKKWYDFHPVTFITRLKNLGNLHVVPSGQIFISRDKNLSKNIETMEFNQGGQRVFASSSRQYSNVWNDAFIYRDNNNKINILWDNLKKFRIGKYYAQLNITWDADGSLKFGTLRTEFWIFPWQLFVIIAAIIILIVIILKVKKKIKKYRKLKEKHKTLKFE